MDTAKPNAHTPDLTSKLDALPEDVQKALRPLLERTVQKQRRRQELMTQAFEALSDLRRHMKYLMFDLEATRRENLELKRRLGEA